ncbi:MAG: hypothetical protein QM755_03090 [Luteolibacter sp.]
MPVPEHHRHARALAVISVFFFGVSLFLPARPDSVHSGWALWGDIIDFYRMAAHGGPAELFRDATISLTAILIILTAPFLLGLLSRSAALLLTLRFLSAGTLLLILLSLGSRRQTCELDGIQQLVFPLLITTLGFFRLRPAKVVSPSGGNAS